jgi:hypothetical protein
VKIGELTKKRCSLSLVPCAVFLLGTCVCFRWAIYETNRPPTGNSPLLKRLSGKVPVVDEALFGRRSPRLTGVSKQERGRVLVDTVSARSMGHPPVTARVGSRRVQNLVTSMLLA